MKRQLWVLTAAIWGLVMLAAAANAATVQVQQIGNSFTPDDITINVGDTVEWTWSSFDHTVTNGTGSLDPNVGNLFDALLDTQNQLVSFTFNSPGDFDYFCRVHELAGMDGIVRVQAAAIPTLEQWAMIVLSALLLVAGIVMLRRRAQPLAT